MVVVITSVVVDPVDTEIMIIGKEYTGSKLIINHLPAHLLSYLKNSTSLTAN